MANKEDIKAGDKLIYVLTFTKQSGIKDKLACVALVEVVKQFEDVCECKFLEVLSDNSGNGYFRYLQQSGKTNNCSLEYLYKIWGSHETRN